MNGKSARPLAAARVAIHGGEGVDDALRTMLQENVGETGLTMQGTALHTTDLNSMTFPRELVQSERVQIDVDLSHYQPQGSPWGMFLVLMLFTTA